jgi:hypothetical protein
VELETVFKISNIATVFKISLLFQPYNFRTLSHSYFAPFS